MILSLVSRPGSIRMSPAVARQILEIRAAGKRKWRFSAILIENQVNFDMKTPAEGAGVPIFRAFRR
jgi:hypothetical protein